MKQTEFSLDLRNKRMETTRLLLRPWEETQSDAEDLYEYAQSPKVGPAAGWRPHSDIGESKRVIQRFRTDRMTYTWAIVLKSSGKVIGSIGLHNRTPRRSLFRRDEREIGYVLNPDYWGNGYMPEAVNRMLKMCFYEFELDAVWCGHYKFNKNSKRVIEKCGCEPIFKREEIMTHQNNEVEWVYYYRWTRKDFLSFFGEYEDTENKEGI